MSEGIRKISEELYRLPDTLPDFVINNEIKKRKIGTGDYVPVINNDWGDVYWKFQFRKNAEWDGAKTDDLTDLIFKRGSRYTLVFPKSNGCFEDLMLKQRPVTRDMLYNHFFIFDQNGYGNRGFHKIIGRFVKNKIYEPHSYVDHISEETVATREEALQMIPDRI